MDNMIGQRIKQRRKELKITQTQIQEQTSISSGNLSCIENGKYLPSAIALVELSKILKCSIDWMLTGNSSISNISTMLDIEESGKDKLLLQYFHELSIDDQDELLMIAKIKVDKGKRNADKLSSSKNITNETA